MHPENKQEEREYNPFDKLINLRDNWSDEIPNEILHGGGEEGNPKFKVRTNWWHAVFGVFMFLNLKNMLQDDLKQETQDFMKEYGEKIENNLTTAADIVAANALIDKILESRK